MSLAHGLGVHANIISKPPVDRPPLRKQIKDLSVFKGII